MALSFGRARPDAAPARATWLTTFADMVTLLLTFLVLIISVTTMDLRTPFTRSEGVLEASEEFVRLGDGALLFSDKSLLSPAVELAENLDRLPPDMELDERELKDAIFQIDPRRTDDYERLADNLAEAVRIFRDNRGLVISWDRELLFPEGGVVLFDDNLTLLRHLAVFLLSLELPVSVESHTNPLSVLEGGDGPEAYDLSLRRSKVAMEYLATLGVAEKRFRLGGHGGSRPRAADPERAWENSRLEIVIYQPERTSLFGR